MPELAEVEFYRKRWDAGLGARIERVHLNAGKRVLRGVNAAALQRALAGAKLIGSEGHGKKMLFRFSGDALVGLHLGMTGKLSVEPPNFAPGQHDHFVLFQPKRTLVFHDPRQFGRVQFHSGATPPPWWQRLPPQPHESGFTREWAANFLARRRKAPVKAALLMQEGFPGIGNWMADEILWRARIPPGRKVQTLKKEEIAELWKQTRWVSRQAMRWIAPAFEDPPKRWLFHARWGNRGKCPRDGAPLKRAQVGGRTTAWCPICQGV